MKEKITAFAIKYKTPLIIVGVLIVIGLIWWMSSSSSKSSSSDGSPKSLAKCLKNKGAKFYGASWCPHCQSQKALFGDAASSLPYIECAEGNRGTKKVCIDAGVTGYPTWKFADGTKQSGEMTFQQLKQKAGC